MSVERVFRVDHQGSPRHAVEREGTLRLLEGDLFEGPAHYKLGNKIEGGRILPPVEPSKIIGIGLNYRDHAAEMKKALPVEPLVFMKPSTAVIGPGDPIRIPPGVGRVDYEAEVGIVIGKRAHRVSRARAWDVVLGLTCVNDVTARELQAKDVQYTRSKSFDTFAPIGPCVAIGLDGGSLDIESWVNGERRQASSTRQLIFSLEDLVAYVSSIMTLLPGDIISTGTPSGVGPIIGGDRVSIKVSGIGELINSVVD